MGLARTREEIANILGAAAAADFPLAVKRETPARLAVCSGQGRALCRYSADDKELSAEIGRLQAIIARLNALEKAAGDEFLRPSAEQCEQFREAVRRVWAAKLKDADKIRPAEEIYKGKPPRWGIVHKGRLIRPNSIIDKAVKPPFRLGEELAAALFARVVKAGIMPLCHVTYGKKYYDLRYYANREKLNAFLKMGAQELLRVLSPVKAPRGEDDEAVPAAPEEKAAAAKADGGDKTAFTASAAPQAMPAFAAAPAAISAPAAAGRTKTDGFCEDSAPAPIPETAAAGNSLDDSELFFDPRRPSEEGTLKHKAVADKLRRELSPVFSLHGVPIFKFDKSILFKATDGGSKNVFNAKEISGINRIMKRLLGSDIVLVEYSIPVKKGMAGVRKQIDVVAFNSEERILKIIDWKFGTNPVMIDNNAQLKGYVQCLLEEVFLNNNVELIQVFLVQPNWKGIKSWEAPKEDFL